MAARRTATSGRGHRYREAHRFPLWPNTGRAGSFSAHSAAVDQEVTVLGAGERADARRRFPVGVRSGVQYGSGGTVTGEATSRPHASARCKR